MIESGYDLPLSLSVCHQLQDGWDVVACKSGSFMENISTRYGFRSPYVKDSDPLYPCEVVQMRDRWSCYNRASGRSLDLNGHDYAATVRMCRSIDPRWSQACFRARRRPACERLSQGRDRRGGSLGASVVGVTSTGSPAALVRSL